MGGKGSEGMRPRGITKSPCSRSDGKRGVQLSLAGTLRITPEATALSYLPSRACARVCVWGPARTHYGTANNSHLSTTASTQHCKKSKQYCFILMFGILRAIRKTRIRQGIMLVPSKAVRCTLFKILRETSLCQV